MHLGERLYRCKKGHYTAAPVPLAVVSRIAEASAELPFLALLVDLTPALVGELDAQLDGAGLEAPGKVEWAFFHAPADHRLLEAGARLARLLESTKDARDLGPLAVRELLIHLLRGNEGPSLRRFLRAGSAAHRVYGAVHRLDAEAHQSLDVSALASDVGMSRSAFFKSFKEATAMSPLQYQKRLRLMEARRILHYDGETAEGASHKVGYASPSQFSRDYVRMFGTTPGRDAKRSKVKAGSPRPIWA
jgi:AraC-like DNA-binding protein